jgi:hypothetical protein
MGTFMDTIYSRLSKGSAPRELSFETLLWITVVLMSSVSLAGAGVRGVAELKNGFGERASTLSHYGPVSREYLDKRTGDFRNEAGLAPAVKNPDGVILNRMGPLGTAENQDQAPRTQESAASTTLRSNFQDQKSRGIFGTTSTNATVGAPVATSQAKDEARNRINERFGEYAKKLAGGSRFAVAQREERLGQLDRCRAFLVNLIYVGYAPSLVESWSDDLLDDEVVDGMPMDLVDLYWGSPIYTQDFVEYYVPYQNRGYRTPAGDYRQVTFANNVVAEAQAMSHEVAQ